MHQISTFRNQPNQIPNSEIGTEWLKLSERSQQFTLSEQLEYQISL